MDGALAILWMAQFSLRAVVLVHTAIGVPWFTMGMDGHNAHVAIPNEVAVTVYAYNLLTNPYPFNAMTRNESNLIASAEALDSIGDLRAVLATTSAH